MRTIKGTLSLGIGFATANREDNFEIEVDDDATDNQIDDIIEEEWKNWIWNFIDGGWDIKSDEIDED